MIRNRSSNIKSLGIRTEGSNRWDEGEDIGGDFEDSNEHRKPVESEEGPAPTPNNRFKELEKGLFCN